MSDNKPVILCLDDDPDILSFLEVVLEAEGFTFVGADSAEPDRSGPQWRRLPDEPGRDGNTDRPHSRLIALRLWPSLSDGATNRIRDRCDRIPWAEHLRAAGD